MKKYFALLPLVLIFILASCEQRPRTEQRYDLDTINIDTNHRMQHLPTDTLGHGAMDISITDEQFISDLFIFDDVTLANLRSNFQNAQIAAQEVVQSRHTPSSKDTIYTVNIGTSKFKIYKSDERELIQSADIYNDIIMLNRNIRVGMSMNDFIRKFDHNLIGNNIHPNSTITVRSATAYDYVDFEFKNNRLEHIHFYGYID